MKSMTRNEHHYLRSKHESKGYHPDCQKRNKEEPNSHRDKMGRRVKENSHNKEKSSVVSKVENGVEEKVEYLLSSGAKY